MDFFDLTGGFATSESYVSSPENACEREVSYNPAMPPKIAKCDDSREFFAAQERCYIVETWRSQGDTMTVARARVEPGVTTAWHALEGVTERYVIASGSGRMEVGDLPPTDVGPGDTVFIPAGVRQRIANTGAADLIFYCVCTPPFTPECYRDLEGM